MPTYHYRCSECSFEQEVVQRISEEPLHVCPNCGKESFARVISGGAGVLYKGEGWYVTDYSKKSSGGKESSTSAAPTPAATPSKASEPSTPAPTPKP